MPRSDLIETEVHSRRLTDVWKIKTTNRRNDSTTRGERLCWRIQLARRYMGETNKPLKKYDPNFLFQTASVYYNLDDILSVEKPSVKLEGVDRIEEIFRITDEIPNDWIAYHEVLFLRGRCFLEINRFDELKKFSTHYIQTPFKLV